MADTPNEATVIGSDIHIKGEMSFQKSVRLVGSFEGSIRGEGELQVAKGASCKAEVDSSSIVVEGLVEGNLVARDSVHLNKSGVVKGDIVAGRMVMAEGASFFGKCAVGPEAVKSVERPAKPAGNTPRAQANQPEARAAGSASGK
jgi:cytoskeletal protein CcmA (bactofilin family)